MIQIKNLFCVGKIYIKEKSILFRATSIKDLSVIIDHFEKYPFITDKWSDFRLFKLAFKLIERQEHLTKNGLYKIVAIKASMNRGLSS